MAFWSQSFADKTLKDPKRKFRFIVQITSIGTDGGTLWYAKTATKPSFQIGAAEHSYLNHKFYYPGGVTWQDVSITLVDPVDPNIGMTLASIVELSGYNPPGATFDAESLATISKGKAVSSLGQVTITQLDGEGRGIENWTLWNAFITELKFGDLEYGSDDILELSITLKYDWARVDIGEAGTVGVTSPSPGQVQADNKAFDLN